jgi:hypothetical protein
LLGAFMDVVLADTDFRLEIIISVHFHSYPDSSPSCRLRSLSRRGSTCTALYLLSPAVPVRMGRSGAPDHKRNVRIHCMLQALYASLGGSPRSCY